MHASVSGRAPCLRFPPFCARDWLPAAPSRSACANKWFCSRQSWPCLRKGWPWVYQGAGKKELLLCDRSLRGPATVVCRWAPMCPETPGRRGEGHFTAGGLLASSLRGCVDLALPCDFCLRGPV